MPRATLFLLTITANAAFFGRQRRKPDVPAGGLACDDGYTAVPASYVNDDYCDCADGADEPRTAACSGVTVLKRFACADGSGVPRRGWETASATAATGRTKPKVDARTRVQPLLKLPPQQLLRPKPNDKRALQNAPSTSNGIKMI